MDANLKNKEEKQPNIQLPSCKILDAVGDKVSLADLRRDGVKVQLEVLLPEGYGITFVVHKTGSGGPAVYLLAKEPLTVHYAVFTPVKLEEWDFPVGATVEVWAYFGGNQTPSAVYTIVA